MGLVVLEIRLHATKDGRLFVIEAPEMAPVIRLDTLKKVVMWETKSNRRRNFVLFDAKLKLGLFVAHNKTSKDDSKDSLEPETHQKCFA